MKYSQSLVWFLRAVLIFIFLILGTRLFELQIIKGAYFRSLSDNNRIKKIPIVAPRGQILARGGEVLVGNKDGKRYYPLGSGVAHLSGYLGEVNQDELGKVDPHCPGKGPKVLGAQVGRAGIEEQYSCTLQGINGEELVEVDTHGKKIRVLGTKDPIPGEDITTTIDYGLQKKVSEVINSSDKLPKERKAAVIITDYKGQVLALYSSPAFDPGDNLKDAFLDKSLPVFNRVISGAYHPGSVFKIVSSAAGLEDHKITKDYQYQDPGVVIVNKFSYANWLFTKYGRREGIINLERALARSTDTFFYKLGEMVGADSLVSWSKQFGYGEKTGIDIPGEVEGLVPSPAWKKEVKKENWFLGNTYHLAIGQGDLTATPLQVNRAIGVIASDGLLCSPYIVSRQGRDICKKLPINASTIETIKKGMIAACSAGGTAVSFFNFIPQVACKTGTAETEEEDKTHSWVSVIGPDTVMTVLAEKAGEGSEVATPIAHDIFLYWLHDRNP